MQDKIASAQKIIEMVNENYRNPIIYSGFGKDSICVIHLCYQMGLKWDVMFHRDPYFPLKYKYANMMIEKWNVVCRDYPAHKCSIFWLNNTFEVVRHYQTGSSDMVLCAMLYEPKNFNGEYLCALKDIYLQPKGTMLYPWDIGIQGHKAAECKPHGGMKPNGLRWPMKHTVDGVDWAQPIWNWTEEDVYRYMADNDIPINTGVYEVAYNRLVPKEDNAYNPDRRPACFRCMKPDNDRVVFCPKKGCLVNNISDTLERVKMPNDFPGYDKE
jgi:hypothetical protein